jgi:hypothetical protein
MHLFLQPQSQLVFVTFMSCSSTPYLVLRDRVVDGAGADDNCCKVTGAICDFIFDAG